MEGPSIIKMSEKLLCVLFSRSWIFYTFWNDSDSFNSCHSYYFTWCHGRL